MNNTPRGCLAFLLRIANATEPTDATDAFEPAYAGHTYNPRGPLLSANESTFFECLQPVISGKAHIFAKVRLADILKAGSGEGFNAAHAKIAQKHVDFLLCKLSDYSPLLVIEVDDKSHATKRAAKADAEKNHALNQAGIKLLRVPAASTYDPEDIAARIQAAVSKARETT